MERGCPGPGCTPDTVGTDSSSGGGTGRPSGHTDRVLSQSRVQFCQHQTQCAAASVQEHPPPPSRRHSPSQAPPSEGPGAPGWAAEGWRDGRGQILVLGGGKGRGGRS